MNVRSVPMPEETALHKYYRAGDFADSFFGPQDPPRHTAPEAARIAFEQMPQWIKKLMWLRNAIVRPFGLKTGDDYDKKPLETLEVGKTIGVFKIEQMSEDEIILGEDDRHLNFRLSILRTHNGYVMTTWVHTHNIFGKIYLTTIMPFHKIIVAATTKRIISAD